MEIVVFLIFAVLFIAGIFGSESNSSGTIIYSKDNDDYEQDIIQEDDDLYYRRYIQHGNRSDEI